MGSSATILTGKPDGHFGVDHLVDREVFRVGRLFEMLSDQSPRRRSEDVEQDAGIVTWPFEVIRM